MLLLSSNRAGQRKPAAIGISARLLAAERAARPANGTEWERAMSDSTSSSNYIELTAEIVSAYVSNNSVSASELPGLINQVHSALTRVSTGHGEVPAEPLKPAISVKRSITPDYIVC